MPVEDQFGLWTCVTNVPYLLDRSWAGAKHMMRLAPIRAKQQLCWNWTGSGEIQDGPKAWAHKFGLWTCMCPLATKPTRKIPTYLYIPIGILGL
jgi:hypothetical protein